ncbi:MAG: hypothetical protein NVS1B7_3690 [Candidatus Saccharimonadales bacterium]
MRAHKPHISVTATNHALTGALIGLSVQNTLLAITLAFLSHFLLDALPHFGDRHNRLGLNLHGIYFKAMLLVDATLCIVLVGVLTALQPGHWTTAVIAAFVATSPDLAWIPDFITSVRHTAAPKYGKFRQFASAIQWSETPLGIIPEVIWCTGCVTLLAFVIK